MHIALRKLLLLSLALVFFSGLLALLGQRFLQSKEAERAASLFRENKTSVSDKPPLKNLPVIEPMKMENALILEDIGGLTAEDPSASKPWYPPDVAPYWPQEIDFKVNYGAKKDYLAPQPNEMLVSVWVHQLPNDDWALYFAKHSPLPSLVPKNRSLVLSLVRKFGNRVVMDRQFRFPDESGKLLYFWPSGKNLVTVIYYSTVVNEEFLRRYLEKYRSSL
jgi:hypothetical protein